MRIGKMKQGMRLGSYFQPIDYSIITKCIPKAAYLSVQGNSRDVPITTFSTNHIIIAAGGKSA